MHQDANSCWLMSLFKPKQLLHAQVQAMRDNFPGDIAWRPWLGPVGPPGSSLVM